MNVVPMHHARDKGLALKLQEKLSLDPFKALSAAFLISAADQKHLLTYIFNHRNDLPRTVEQFKKTPDLKEPSARAVLVLEAISELSGQSHQVFSILPDSDDCPALLGVAIGEQEEGLVFDSSHNTFMITNVAEWQKAATNEFLASLGPSATAFNEMQQESSLEMPDVC